MYSDNFEHMLKEKADEFKMYPSARVWHSIYNNMHPSRRWPSLTMSIVLIAMLLLLGYSNSNISTNQNDNTTIAAIPAKKEKIVNLSTLNSNKESGISTKQLLAVKNVNNEQNLVVNNKIKIASNRQPDYVLMNTPEQRINHSSLKEPSSIETDDNANAKRSEADKRIFITPVPLSNKKEPNGAPVIDNDNLMAKKEQGKFGLQVYAAPSVVYNGENAEDNVTPSVGLEVGASMQYSLFKKVKLKTGLQLNYTSNNTQGSSNADFTNSGSMFYPVRLNNETYQLSLPVGVELKLLGKDRLHWDIGATIQPGYTIGGGNTYLTSAGKTGYIKESSMLNNWNLNAGFETFITYKINGLTWQLGPQFRYQIMPGYNKNLTVNENLANYGVKLGVSKVLQ